MATSLAKSGLTQLASAGIGGAVDGLGGLLNGALGNGIGQVFINAGVEGAKAFATSTVNSGINAITYSERDGFGFSEEAFKAGMNKGAVSAVAGMASTFTSGALGLGNLRDGNDIALNNRTFNVEWIGKLNDFTGSLVGGAVSYGMSGEVKLNLANYNGVGLLELNLSRENGVSLGLGMGGIDVSLGTIAGAMSGLRDSTKIMGAKAAGLFGDIEDVSTLNAVNMLGYSNRVSNQELAMAIWEEEIKVRYGEIPGMWIIGR